jgi:hypothetical protein
MSQTYPDPATSRRTKRRRALLAVLLGASILMLGSGAFSLARFTDTADATGTWTAGTIILGVSPATTFSVDDILPGDSADYDLAVDNDGTGDLRYAMTSSSVDPDGLAVQMDLTITAGTCAAPGAVLYTGSLDGAWFGDVTQGPDTNDRFVAAGSSDDLCFSWSFPFSSGNAFQAATTDVTFTFDAEQTAHNP